MKFKAKDKVKVTGFYSKKFPFGGRIREYTNRVDGSHWYFVEVLRNPYSIFNIFGKVTNETELLPEKELRRKR